MNRFVLFLVFNILGFEIIAQNKVAISFDVSPTLSFRNYKLIDYSKGNSEFPSGKVYYDRFHNLYDSIESPKYGFQLSFNLNYLIINNFSIQAGIQYKNIGIRYDIAPYLGTYEFNGVTQYIFDYGHKQVLYSKIQYVGIPISLQYNVYSFRNINIGVNVGGAFDLLVSYENSELKSYPYTSQISNASNYSKVNLNATCGIQLSYTMNDKCDIYVMPQYIQYLTPGIKTNLYTADDLFFKFNQFNYYWTLKFGFKYKI